MNVEAGKLEDVCEINFTDEEAIVLVRKSLSDEPKIHRIAEIFKALSDPTRIRVIEALSIRELCVCDLANLLGMTQSAISHQLRILRQNSILKYRKEGRIVYYSLDDEHVSEILDSVASHVSHR
ncbi:MAG: transcriptional regulator [Gammaproteobacteria bacterium]|jgi:DNA-binding transcriptional ArsR family regulator|nr:transcriptional regulator [Gammaproteobacteria bacterium]|tara:strand:- start:31306 stop:31677 length:372 start_codon:yes stop_codon:yes gene_type:complete